METLDVLVVGAGPAGAAAAAALGGRGMTVGWAAPSGADEWPARYGAWLDELSAAGHAASAGIVWPRARIQADAPHVVDRPYALLDNGRLCAALGARCRDGGVRRIESSAAAVSHEAGRSTVTLDHGVRVAARVVVDASGHRPALLPRPSRPEPAYQTAVGWEVLVDGDPLDPCSVLLMDWSGGHLAEGDRGGVPTFLYALPLGKGRLFVEETALAARPAVPYGALEVRLRRRLAAMGIVPREVVATERVWIPMGGALPFPGRVVGYGAAGGMVHPATGYSVARSLADAPLLADALSDTLGREGTTPEDASDAAWEALWPADRRRRFALFRFGAEVLARMDAPRTRAFFDAFCALPPGDVAGYLSDTLSSPELARVMARFFGRAPAPVRKALRGGALGPAGSELAAAVARSWAGA